MNLSTIDWAPVAGQLMKIGAPLLGTLIGGVPGAVVGSVVGSLAEAIGAEPTPESISDKLQTDPAAADAARQFEADNRARLQAEIEHTRQVQIEQANMSLRAEVQAGDRFQRWARPFNMYVLGGVTGCYGVCCVAAAINTIATKDPTALTHLVSLGGVLTTVLIPSGAVAGVTAWQQTKETLAGVVQRPPPPALVPGKIAKRT